MKCALAVVLVALLGMQSSYGQVPVPVPKVPKGVMNPMDLLRMAALFGCRMNGLDGGIDKEFARTMLGFGSPLKVQRCMIGCVIGWLHTTNHFMQWEFGVNLMPTLQGRIMKNVQPTIQGCISQALKSGKKCSMIQELGKCFLLTEKNIMIAKFKQIFMPWLPCWDYLKTKIPVVRTIDKFATKMEDSFIQGIKSSIGNIFSPHQNVSNLDLGNSVTAEPFIGPQEEPGTQRSSDTTGEQPEAEPVSDLPEEPAEQPPTIPPPQPATFPPPPPESDPEVPPNPPTEPPSEPTQNP
ncbi:hypothetical protein C0J52_19378 [Blattella germanica]|nr:hypothetical protein C0J52_19378 [Blattella germanica]